MVSLRGLLRSNDGIIELGDVTKIGRDASCDINLQTLSIELLHAVIERRDMYECFVLQDCNTAHGTYVNDCRVQNGAVNLSHNDVIKFGHGGKPYRLEIEYSRNPESETRCPPISQSGQLRSLREVVSPVIVSDVNASLPQLATNVSTVSSPEMSPRSLAASPVSHVMPRPPARTRPHTANELRVRSVNMATTPVDRSLSASLLRTQSSLHINGQRLRKVDSAIVADFPGDDVNEDLELRLLKMGDELNRLSVFESESCRKDGLISLLRSEVAQLKRELTVQEEAAVSAQKELSESVNTLTVDGSQQRKTIGGLTEERNSLKQQLSEARKNVTHLKRDNGDKSSVIVSLRSELSHIKMQQQQQKATKHDQLQSQLQRIKVQLQASERCVHDRAQKISVLQGEVDATGQQLETNKETIRQLERKLGQAKTDYRSSQNEVEQLVTKLAHEEETLVSFTSKVCNITALANGQDLAKSETGRASVVSHITEVAEQKQSLYNQVEELKETVTAFEEEEKAATEFVTSMQHVLNQLKDALQTANKSSMIETLQLSLDTLSALKVSNNTTWMKDELCERLKFEKTQCEQSVVELQEIVDAVNNACGDLEEEVTDGRDTLAKIQILHQELTNKTRALNELTTHVADSNAKHQSDISEAVSHAQSELETQSARELTAVREEHERQLAGLVEEKRTEIEKKYRLEVQNERDKIEKKEEEIQRLEETLRHKDESLGAIRVELVGVKENEAALQEQVERLQLQMKTLQHAAAAEQNSLGEILRKEIDLYKEQSSQHAITIVALEEKLLTAVNENKILKSGILPSHVKDGQEQFEVKEQKRVFESKMPNDGDRKLMPADERGQRQEIQRLEDLVVSLREQLSSIQQEAHERTDAAESLRRDLIGMQARMSDLVGELDDGQKREIEQLRLRVAHQDEVLRQREDDIQQLEGITRDQAKTLETNQLEVQRQQQLLELRLGEAKEQGSQLSQLADNIVTERSAKETTQRQLDETSQELIEIKAKYQNYERQQQVIERQKEAIQELRDNVRKLEELRPPVPGHEEALRQIVSLKRELNDLKSRDRRCQGTSTDDSGYAALTTTAIQTGPTTPVTLREATNTLDRSEKSYLSFLRALSQSMDLSGMLGVKSVVKLDPSEREKVWSDRGKTATAICSQIKALQEKLHRKEKLLEGYEDDLRKLREFEAERMAHGSALGSLQSELRDKMAEIQLLRESLKRAHEELDQAQRLNQSLVSRQAFRSKHLHDMQSQKRSGHRCMYTDDELQYKIDTQKNATRQLVRKKNYEIEALRRDLHTTQARLDESRDRLLDSSTKAIAGAATS
ncbi:forkhead-associated domain-containing protein 1-like [Corticium candelabrum]|uniref:forkhead-associated domain-containing protein 1-like n=1 Tax=Corticium candelabrum TaxID=121492 RepID=UPI002E26E02A|nr:forkhead-associated domain-containing protein 1-like [Corticium candelabrum]